ncbi:MAG: nucleotidyltransferase, partial [Thermoplasmata archaeon]|nr:nucleotidyltransferase [Thermoplasmata archaeon]
MKCSYCSYEWNPRKPDPVSCPRCKRRFDYPGRKEGADMLAGAKEMERGYQRTLYVMSVLTPILEERGITPVIVGGSAVEFYTRNWYATADIDLAVQKGKRKVLDEVFKEAGFKRSGRMWTREDLGLYIETPGDIYDIDLEKATKVETGDGYAYMIGVEELILDRLQAAQHWKSQADRE